MCKKCFIKTITIISVLVVSILQLCKLKKISDDIAEIRTDLDLLDPMIISDEE